MLIDELLLPEVPDGKNGFRAAAKTILVSSTTTSSHEYESYGNVIVKASSDPGKLILILILILILLSGLIWSNGSVTIDRYIVVIFRPRRGRG